LFVDEDRVGEAEELNGAGDLRDLLLAVRPRVVYERDEVRSWSIFDLEIVHGIQEPLSEDVNQ
jgi:hypothetical protein